MNTLLVRSARHGCLARAARVWLACSPQQRQTRHSSDTVSCTALDVPLLNPLPPATLVVSGGTLLSQKVQEFFSSCENGVLGTSEADLPDFVRLVNLLIDSLKCTVEKEPERDEMIESLLKILCSMDSVPLHPDFLGLLDDPALISELRSADKEALSNLAVKVWDHVLKTSTIEHVLIAATLLLEIHGRVPTEIIAIINMPGFSKVVDSLQPIEPVPVKTNIFLLAGMQRISRSLLSPKVVHDIMANLSAQLIKVPMPKDDKTIVQLAAISRSITHLGYFHEEFLLAYAIFFLHMARSQEKFVRPFVSLTMVANLAYSLSHAGIPSLALLEEMQEYIKPQLFRTVQPELLLHLLWSYLAQGMRPPAGGMAHLDLVLTDLPPTSFRNYGYELEQVRPHLATSRMELGELLAKHRPIPGMFVEAHKRHPELAVGVMTDGAAGMIHACALVNPNTRQLIPWNRANVQPDDLSGEDVDGLPGTPVAVVPCFYGSTYAPRGRLAGPLYRKQLLLEELGWKVIVLDMSQHWSRQKSGISALMSRIKTIGTSK
eukprot:scpid56013/ scgid14186/ 